MFSFSLPHNKFGVLQSYSRWRGANKDVVLQLLHQRLGIDSNFILYDDQFVEIISSDKPSPLRLDLRASDAFLALCECSKTDREALKYLLSLAVTSPFWVVAMNVDQMFLLRVAVHSIVWGAGVVSGVPQKLIVEHLMTAIIRWAQYIDSIAQIDPVHIRKCVNAALEGLHSAFHDIELTGHVSSIVDNFEDLSIRKSNSSINITKKPKFSPETIKCVCKYIVVLLEETSFDIRLVIGDAPADFCLEEVVKNHFSPTINAINLLWFILNHCSIENLFRMSGKPSDSPLKDRSPKMEISKTDSFTNSHEIDQLFENLKSLCLDYLQCLANYLINSISSEPFMCKIMRSIMDLYVALSSRYDFDVGAIDIILSIFGSFKFFKSYANFGGILMPLAYALLSHSVSQAQISYRLIKVIKSIVFSLSNRAEYVDFPDIERCLAEGGKILGLCLRNLLQTDRLFCESFVSNMVLELSSAGDSNSTIDLEDEIVLSDEGIRSLSIIVGSIAIAVEDEGVSSVCLSTLLTQFNRFPASKIMARESFLNQFASMAVFCGDSVFRTVLDTIINLVRIGEHPSFTIGSLATIARMLGQESDKSTCALLSEDQKKRQVTLLFSLIRLFVERGVAIIGERGKKTLITQSDLDLLIQVICISIKFVQVEELQKNDDYVVVFQELWLILIFLGYQQNLKWRPEWSDHIPEISSVSPVLIKKRDRLQAPTSTFSQVVLDQFINPSLRNHLSQLMPNCSRHIKNVTFAQCIWLLSIYYCELNKFKVGNFENICAYLQSEIVHLLGVFPFIEDLFRTIIIAWRQEKLESGIFGDLGDLRLAMSLSNNLCHCQPHTHRAAVRFLREFFFTIFPVFSSSEIWEMLIERIGNMYFVCMACLGASELADLPENITRDPILAKECFGDMLELCREVFGRASNECPTTFFTFANNIIYNNASQNLQCSSQSNQFCDHSMTGTSRIIDRRPLSASHRITAAMQRDIGLIELLQVLVNPSRSDNSPSSYLSSVSTCSLGGKEFLSKLEIHADEKPSALSILRRLEVNSVYSDEKVLDPLNLRRSLYLWIRGLEEALESSNNLMAVELLCSFCSVEISRVVDWILTTCSEIFSRSEVNIESSSFEDMHPLRKKISYNPSKPIDRNLESVVIMNAFVLLDFLKEYLLLDLLHVPANYLFYCQIITTILRLVNTRHIIRVIGLKALLFCFQFLKNSIKILNGSLVQSLQEEIWAAAIQMHSSLHQFSVAPTSLIVEELNIINSIMEYLWVEEVEAGRRFVQVIASANFKGVRSPVSTAMRRAEIATAIYAILRIEYRDTLAIMGSLQPAASGPPSLNNLDVINKNRALNLPSVIQWASSVSLEFALALAERTRYKEMFPIVATVYNCRQLVISSALSTAALMRRWMVPVEMWIYAAPLLIPSAVRLFKPIDKPEEKDPSPATLGSLTISPVMILNYVKRSLESCPVENLFFYIPQLVQMLRWDGLGFVESCIMSVAHVSPLFAHQIIWNFRANEFLDENGTTPNLVLKPRMDLITRQIIAQFTPDQESFYKREFKFFDSVTNISGALKPYVKREKWEKKAKLDEELARIVVDAGVYLPSNPECVVIGIDYKSGVPLQSHAKTPYMACFRVKPADNIEVKSNYDTEAAVINVVKEKSPIIMESAAEHTNIHEEDNSNHFWQATVFKVGDDCRQDILAIQLMALFKTLFDNHQVPVYMFPYRVVATAPGCGIIEMIPNSMSRSNMGIEKINSLYEFFVFRFGGDTCRAFHEARINFVRSMAAYSIFCYLLAVKDRHNGNILIDDAGHILHIDFGFILDFVPGRNLVAFEPAFKLTSEMLQVMGGKGEDVPYFCWFRELCVQCFLVCRIHAAEIIQLVEAMSNSGLPCFCGGENTIKNLRNRLRLDLDTAGARSYVFDLVRSSCEAMRTNIYDYFQLSTNGIPY